MRQAGADDDQRRAGLRQLMARGADRGHIGSTEILHLIDEERDPDADVPRDSGGVAEQLHQIDLDVAGIRPAARRRYVDARLPAVADLPAGGLAQRERLEYAEELLDPLGIAVPAGEFPHGHVQGAGDRPSKGLLGPGLDLARPPTPVDRRRAELVEQHRLTHAAQPGQHQ